MKTKLLLILSLVIMTQLIFCQSTFEKKFDGNFASRGIIENLNNSNGEYLTVSDKGSLLKFDNNGNPLWQVDQLFYSYTASSGNLVTQTTDGNYVVVGHCDAGITCSGKVSWTKIIDGIVPSIAPINYITTQLQSTTNDVSATSDGGFVIVGDVASLNNSFAAVIKMNASSNIV